MADQEDGKIGFFRRLPTLGAFVLSFLIFVLCSVPILQYGYQHIQALESTSRQNQSEIKALRDEFIAEKQALIDRDQAAKDRDKQLLQKTDESIKGNTKLIAKLDMIYQGMLVSDPAIGRSQR